MPKKLTSPQLLASEFDVDGRAVPLRLVVNRRAKRLIVRFDPASGELIVTAPSKSALPDALAFARTRLDWVSEQLAAAPKGTPFAPGATIPFRGAPHILDADPLSRTPVWREPGAQPRLVVSGHPAHFARRLEDWLRAQARKHIEAQVDVYAPQLRRRVKRITIRDPRTRWGSCSAQRALSFSWRLILAPPYVLDYVVAHECAHLVEMNHGPAFWRTVERLYGSPDRAMAWLKDAGGALHAYG